MISGLTSFTLAKYAPHLAAELIFILPYKVHASLNSGGPEWFKNPSTAGLDSTA